MSVTWDECPEHGPRCIGAPNCSCAKPSAPTPRDPAGETPPCPHCWHQYGVASGGISTTGSYAKGTNRCCHCGKTEPYEYSTTWTEPPRHGRFYLDIQRHPR